MLDNLHTPTQQEARDYFRTHGIVSSQADKWWQRQEQYHWSGRLKPQESADHWIAHTDAQFLICNRKIETPDCLPTRSATPVSATPVSATSTHNDLPAADPADPLDPPYRQWRTYTDLVMKIRYRDFLSPKERRLLPRYRQYWALFNRKYPQKRLLNIDAV